MDRIIINKPNKSNNNKSTVPQQITLLSTLPILLVSLPILPFRFSLSLSLPDFLSLLSPRFSLLFSLFIFRFSLFILIQSFIYFFLFPIFIPSLPFRSFRLLTATR